MHYSYVHFGISLIIVLLLTLLSFCHPLFYVLTLARVSQINPCPKYSKYSIYSKWISPIFPKEARQEWISTDIKTHKSRRKSFRKNHKICLSLSLSLWFLLSHISLFLLLTHLLTSYSLQFFLLAENAEYPSVLCSHQYKCVFKFGIWFSMAFVSKDSFLFSFFPFFLLLLFCLVVVVGGAGGEWKCDNIATK